MDHSQVGEFYRDQTVFVTGATGFIGKALVEKILYSCPDVKRIYILIRPKKDVEDSETNNRFQEFLNSHVFERLKRERPNDLKKIVPVWGELVQPNLNISTEIETELIDEVTIVFHSAAAVRFNEPLKVAIEINLIGTKNVLELFKKLKRPTSFVYVSTAFSHCQRDLIEETVYPLRLEPDFLIKLHQKLDEKSLDCLTENALEGRPNTYTLSKAAAEDYLEQHSGNLPIAIVRPSIVENALNEPVEGAKGLVHNFPAKEDAPMDIVPVDLLVNLLIVVSWYTAIKNKWSGKLPVYNFVSVNRNAMTARKMLSWAMAYNYLHPIYSAVNMVFVSCTTNEFLLTIEKVRDHYIPALIVDFILMFTGKKPEYFKMYQRYFTTLPALTYFVAKFRFKSDNVDSLQGELSLFDQRMFNFDVASFKWDDYMVNFMEGTRKYLVPEDCGISIELKKRKHRMSDATQFSTGEGRASCANVLPSPVLNCFESDLYEFNQKADKVMNIKKWKQLYPSTMFKYGGVL